MLGVAGAQGSLGLFDLNQGVYTVMSYNDGWPRDPDGAQPLTAGTVGFGWSGSLSAFDIAELQDRYGVHAYNDGNTVYQLPDAEASGTFFQTIWDSGGTDTIAYSGTRNAQIDLLAATLDYSPTGGGVVSYATGIHGGLPSQTVSSSRTRRAAAATTRYSETAPTTSSPETLATII